MRKRSCLVAALSVVVALVTAASVGAGPTPGVTLDSGALHTNRATVTLTLVPPTGATDVAVWNEDDEAAAERFVVSEEVSFDWKLATAGPDNVPRTVRARFTGPGVDGTQVYSDGILLDRTRPRIRSAKASRGSGGRRACTFTLRLNARDNLSGIAAMDYSFGRGTEVRSLGYQPVRRIRVPRAVRSPSVLVLHVTDGAGNVSKQRRVGIRRVCS
jgi:hypothetical protein